MATEVKEQKKPTEMNLRELYTRRAKIWEGEMKDQKFKDLFRDARNGKDIPKEQEAEFDQWDAELRQLDTEIEVRERDEKINSLAAQRGPKIPGTDTESDEYRFDPKFVVSTGEIRSTLEKFQKREFKKKYMNDKERRILALSERQDEVFLKLFRSNFSTEFFDEEERAIASTLIWKDTERRAQSTTTTAGGYTIPQGFLAQIIPYFKFISAFFAEQAYPNVSGGELDSVFNVIRTESGNALPVPTNDDTASIGELISENGDISSSSGDLTFGQVTLNAYKYSSKMIKVSNELLQDTGVDLTSYLAKQMGTRLGRILNQHFTTGNNSSKPQGVTVGISVGKVAGSSGAMSFPEIIDLVHSVDPSYRAMPSARYMLHDTILKTLKKLTVGAATTNARPLWAPGYDVGAPATIDGYQYLINQDMDSTIASGKKIMLFGDMKQYAVRWVNNLRVVKLSERYAELDQVAFFALMRADGRWLNTSGVKYYAGT